MKIVFFGSSEFAVPSLERLLDSAHALPAVVTQPDRKKGRHLAVGTTPLKDAASSRSLKIYQPEDTADSSFIKELRSLSADLFVVVSFGQLLPEEVLKIPKLFSVNLHASLLPKYRGAAPINWAIVKGETKTGLTVIRMNEKLDAGDIILQGKVVIEKEDTALTLSKRMSLLGSLLLLDTIRLIENGKAAFKRQNERNVTLAPSLKKEDGVIDWKKSGREIHNMIRGLIPWPAAFTFLDGKLLKIWKSETLASRGKPEPGHIIDARDAMWVSCGKDILIIKELQLEGGKRMDAASFIRGHKLEKGTVLGCPASDIPNITKHE